MRAHPRIALTLLVSLAVGCAAPGPPPPVPPAAAAAPAAAPGWHFSLAATEPPSPAGAVSSDAALATKVGVEILRAGGNAADAAVAVAFALAVVYPAAGNLGGGGFAVARMGGQARALDFRETAPAKASRDMYLGPDGKKTNESLEGHRSSGVPGSVAGLHELYQVLGSKKKTWAELIAPAIALASQGFVADQAFAEFVAGTAALKKWPASAALFLPGGKPIAKGERWKNPDVARVLERIAAQGPAGFYQGPTAAAIAEEMKAHGGLITLADLAGYRARWRAPITFGYRGRQIVAMPPPSSGGLAMAMICNILSGYDLSRLPWHGPAELHYLFEAMRRAFAARNANLGDPDFVKNPVAELLSAAWAEQQRASIKPDRATPSSEITGAVSTAEGTHTTHFSVVDAAGNAVALTTTLNAFFGNGITVPGTGMVLNDEMDDFAVAPGVANLFGLVQGEANAIAPGKRMLSSMSPTIVVGQDGKVEVVAGAAGGATIITATFQVVSNVIDHGLDPVAAVSAPRFHMQHLPDVVAFEKDGLPATLAAPLRAMGYTFAERDHLADAPAIGRVPGGWRPAPEPRRPGSTGAGY
jgi:gamma-glutamyltranspeptidase/glutathione hydrolase